MVFYSPDSDKDLASQSQGSTILGSAPSFLKTPPSSAAKTEPEDISDLDLADTGSQPKEEEGAASVPAIFLESKKIRKSWVWDASNGEEFLEDGKWRWRCVRCKFSCQC